MEQIQLSSLREDMQAVITAVKRSEKPVLIADNGELLVKIVPVPTAGQSWVGSMKGTGKIVGDIVSPAEDAEAWEALSQ